MLNPNVEYKTLDLPEFGLPAEEPTIPPEVYRRRISRLKTKAAEMGFDFFIVYGDREHFANVTYLTGYDPRFEETLLIVPVDGVRGRKPGSGGNSPSGAGGTRAGLNNGPLKPKPVLLVGNEGLGYAGISPLRDELEIVLFQSLSLLAQDRSKSKPLGDILRDAGVARGMKIGVAGWKHFTSEELGGAGGADPRTTLEIPSFMAEAIRAAADGTENVINANALLMASPDGMRNHNEPEQLAQFEFAGAHASQYVRNVLFGLKPGMSEYEAVELMRLKGIPFSAHLMLSAGERAHLGMGSPSSRAIKEGDPFTTAVGVWGGLTSRAGFVVGSEAGLPEGIRDYRDRLAAPYFSAIAAWYERIGIGTTGGELFEAIDSRIGDPFFGVGLNPGHFIHLDEWVDSPIYKNSKETLQSGMALQVDVIPATHSPYFMSNIEDGIALADEPLREKFAHNYPEAWERITARREFMKEALGINLKPEVLPFSNIPAYLPPFLLSPEKAMCVVAG